MPEFIPGLKLNAMFFQEVIRPLMEEHFPKLRYSFGLMGEGSDVLGFDNETSMDHNWGPRGILFLSETDFPLNRKLVDEVLQNNLPREFHGFPTNYTPERKNYLVQQPQPKTRGPVNHMIKIHSIRSFFEYYLGFNPYQDVNYRDWLTFPQQALMEVTAGAVYHDGLGKLNEVREKFRYYPKDVWLYIMRVQWDKIADELSYPGRSGKAGDEIGSYLVTARITSRIMTLCFIMEKQYVPYSKWFGTAFQRLIPARKMTPLLLDVLHSKDWKEREQHLGEAYQLLGKLHNMLEITEPVSTDLVDFHGRGYKVLDAGKYIAAITRQIKDPRIRSIKYPLGAIDQFIDHARINHLHYIYRKVKPLID